MLPIIFEIIAGTLFVLLLAAWLFKKNDGE